MRVDTAIIGGGLSALVCGIRLQRSGKSTVILSAGQNSLFFFSGAFGVLSRLPDGTAVERPFEAVSSLPSDHPYSKIGQEKMKGFAAEFKQFFGSCGVELNGCGDTNSFRYLANGRTKPAWASLKDTAMFTCPQALSRKKVLIVSIPGFMDFFPKFVKESLEREENNCRIIDVSTEDTDALKASSSVVRSLSLAKIFDQDDKLEKFVEEVRMSLNGDDTVILPQVFGLKNPKHLDYIRKAIPAEVLFLNTMTPSVPGNRLYAQLKAAYESAGGSIASGNVRSANTEGTRVISLNVDGMDAAVEAGDFVLASGSFVSKGLISNPESVFEPVFGLDVEAGADRSEWYLPDAAAKQNYIGYGVRTDSSFHPSVNGQTMDNLHAAGSVLAGANSLYEGSGAGTAIFTAMRVADLIIGQ